MQVCPPRQKTPKFGFQAYIFSRAWKWKGVVPNKFPWLFGMYLITPDHQHIKNIFEGTEFLKNDTREWPFSRFEPRKQGSEPRFQGSKRVGISRVKDDLWQSVYVLSLHQSSE